METSSSLNTRNNIFFFFYKWPFFPTINKSMTFFANTKPKQPSS